MNTPWAPEDRTKVMDVIGPAPVAKVLSWPERVEQQVRDLFFEADIRNKPVPDGAIADLIRSHGGDLGMAKGAGL